MTNQEQLARNLWLLRTSRGLSQQEVADHAGLSRNAYRSIEAGRAEPRARNLQAIAQALDVPLPELLAAPPSLEGVRFRSHKAISRKQQARRDEVVVRVARWLKDFNSLEELLDEPREYQLSSLVGMNQDSSGSGSPVDMARLTRERLGLSRKEPIRDICGLLESAGVKVWPATFEYDRFFGLSVAADDGGPAVVVNVRDDITIERRIFTAAHELGHLLLHPHAYDVDEIQEDDHQERQADQFASHFLMPDETFKAEWQDTRGLAFLDRVLHVKRLFRVSYATVLFRLVELGSVGSTKAWMVFRSHWKRRTGSSLRKKDEPMPLQEVDFLEDRLSRLVRCALEREEISLSRAAEILGLNLKSMREVVASWDVAA
ncbi:MAG: helix-turn-helix domain-containing protein [Phycisphaerae bacterium]